jgi:molybdate transport system substrate-binding protein
MQAPIRAISSMATRQLLAELAAAWERARGRAVRLEAVGGVDAARRVAGGEDFDAVVLAAEAIDRLAAGGSVLAGSRVDLVRSPVAIAVRAGAPRPDVSTLPALAAALGGTVRIGYSTGPSGTFLLQLFERLGLAPGDRLVQARPGVPVASLVAGGECDIGVQQLPELLHAEGIAVLGTLPPGAEHLSTFAGAVCAASAHADAVRDWLAFMNTPDAAAAKRRHGMEPAA